MEVHCQNNQWDVDRGQMLRKPLWKIEVGDGAASRSKRVGELCERTAEPIRRKEQALAADHCRCYRCTAIRAIR